jgi:hypothetical protein
MYTTTNISLAHQVFDVGLIHKSVDTILQIFKKTIPSNIQSNSKILYERATLLLESPLSLEEKRVALKRIVVTYPNLIVSTLKSLESKFEGKSLLEHLLNRGEKSLLIDLLRSLDEESILFFLTTQKFYALELILLKKDTDIFKELSPRPLIAALRLAIALDLEFTLTFLQNFRLNLLSQLYHSAAIEGTYELFCEILNRRPQNPGCILQEIDQHKYEFTSAYLNLWMKRPDQTSKFREYFLRLRPELSEATECTSLLSKPDLQPSELEKFSSDTLLILLSLPKIIQSLSLQKRVDLVRCLSFKLEDPTVLLRQNHHGRIPLFDLFFTYSMGHENLVAIFPSLEPAISRLQEWVDLQDYSLTRFEEIFSIEERMQEPILSFFLERTSTPHINIPSTDFCLQRYGRRTLLKLLSFLDPWQIREIFSYFSPEQMVLDYERVKIRCNETDRLIPFHLILTRFYETVYPRLEHKLNAETEELTPSMRFLFDNSLGCAPAGAFFLVMSNPVLRTFIVDLIDFLNPSILKVVIPLLRPHELHKVLKRYSIQDVFNFIPFFAPQQESILEEFLGPYLCQINHALLKSNFGILNIQKMTLIKLQKTVSFKSLETHLAKVGHAINQFLNRAGAVQQEKILCPIKGEPPDVPVKIRTIHGEEQYIYDKEALLVWLRRNNISPMTRAEVSEVISLDPQQNQSRMVSISSKVERYLELILSYFGFARGVFGPNDASTA